jgi:aryl sulfotransferase
MSASTAQAPGWTPTRVYRNHHLDSTRWRLVEPRPDDIVIATSYKSGTTWMQAIVHGLVFGDAEDAPPFFLASPWVDRRFAESPEELEAYLAAQTHRRFLKTHLPVDGLPHHEGTRYVVVARDARDVFMSLWNHWRNYTEAAYARFDGGDREGAPMPRWRDDLHGAWRDWMTRGWFAWESEGYPFWSNLHHTATWWAQRHRPDVLLVHYNDLLADLEGEIARLAEFLGIDASPAQVAGVAARTRFDAMKEAAQIADEPLSEIFAGGANAFIYKGSNGRWREVLGEEDLALYEAARRRVLPPDCADWLERGWRDA